MRKKKHKILRTALLCLFASLLLALSVFMHFGGFGPGKSADPKEFASYAGNIQDISIPKEARIIALGEATHGNVEFQELKLKVINYPGASTQALCSAPTSPLTALAFRSCSRKRESGVCEFVCLCFYI